MSDDLSGAGKSGYYSDQEWVNAGCPVNQPNGVLTLADAKFTIAQQAARIAELVTDQISYEQRIDDLENRLANIAMKRAQDIVSLIESQAECDQLRADLEQQRGGVVLPERAAENTGNWGQELQARARNETLDEVASLNPPGKWSSAPSWGAIHNVLRNYHLATAVDDEGGAYPLIDAISVAGDDVSSGISECEYLADAIYDAILNPPRKFRLGDPVRKTKGSQWSGRVVGFYSTEQTPDGYAVESFTEKGSVQIYPGSALEPCEEPGECVAVPDGCKFELGFDVLDKPFRFVDSKSHVPTIKIILPACAPEDMEAFDVRDKIAKSVCALLAQQGKAVGDE